MGESQDGTQSGHPAVYLPFDFKQQGQRLRSMAVAWYCTEGQRVYVLVYATNSEVSDQDFTTRFEEHLDSFGCHVTD